jgi:hypothetical protein
VTHLNGIVELNDLELKVGNELKVGLLANLLELRSQVTVSLLRLFNTGEQILDDVLEKGEIINQELRDVDVTESSKQELLLVDVGEVILKQTSSVNNGTYSAHTVIVMILG